jgi:hypothetical protein
MIGATEAEQFFTLNLSKTFSMQAFQDSFSIICFLSL